MAPDVGDSVAAGERYSLDNLLTRAFASRADLDAQASRVAAAGQGVTAATASRWPTVSLTAGYNSAYSSATDPAFADQLDQRQAVALQVRRAYLDMEAAREQLAAAEAQQRASDLAVRTSQERYRAGASTLVELTQARATQVQAASAVVNARYNLVFQRAVMSYYTGELDPAALTLRA